VTAWSPTVTVAERELVEVLAASVSVTEPFPLPLAGDTVAQLWFDDAVQAQPAWAVTVTVCVPALAVTLKEVGAAVKVHGTPACVTVTAWPPTVTVAERELVEVLAASVSVTEPFPLPLAGDTVTQLWFDEAVHAQPACAVTVTVCVPAPAVTLNEVGAAVKVQGTPACVTVTAWPPTVTVAVRELVEVLAARVTVTEPFPLPLAGDTVTQLWFDDAVQAQPACAVTVTVCVPALAVTLNEVGAAV
jgi:hypothetical protein